MNCTIGFVKCFLFYGIPALLLSSLLPRQSKATLRIFLPNLTVQFILSPCRHLDCFQSNVLFQMRQADIAAVPRERPAHLHQPQQGQPEHSEGRHRAGEIHYRVTHLIKELLWVELDLTC